jgi:hypothetical protein
MTPNPTASTIFPDGSTFTFPLLGYAAVAYDAACEAALPPAVAKCRANYSAMILNPVTQAEATQLLQAAVATGYPIDYETICLNWGFAAVASQRNRYGFTWAPSYGMLLPMLSLLMVMPAPTGAIIVTPIPPAPPAPPPTPPPTPENFNVGWYAGGAAPGAVGARYGGILTPAPPQDSFHTVNIAGTLPIGTEVQYVSAGFTMFGQIWEYVITALASGGA